VLHYKNLAPDMAPSLFCGLGGQRRGPGAHKSKKSGNVIVFLLQCTDDCSQMRFAAVKRKNFAGNLDSSQPADISRAVAGKSVPICVCKIFVLRQASANKIDSDCIICKELT
jgi:hypothetical protein